MLSSFFSFWDPAARIATVGDEEDREAILARRRKFIAVAFASVSTLSGCGDQQPEPQPCLSVEVDPDQDDRVDEAEPLVCLEYAEPPVEPEPQPCLSPMPDPEPEPEPETEG